MRKPSPARTETLVARPGVAQHTRTHRRVGLQCGCIHTDPLALHQPTVQNPSTHWKTSPCVSRSINRRVREIVDDPASSRPARSPTAVAPASPPSAKQSCVRCRCLEIPDQQRPKVDPWRQRRPPARRIVLHTAFDNLSKPSPPVTRLAADRTDVPERQLGVGNPDVLCFSCCLRVPIAMRAFRNKR